VRGSTLTLVLWTSPLERKAMAQKPVPAISLSTELEAEALRSTTVHKIWGSVTLLAQQLQQPGTVPVDFVIAIDVSASMRIDNKLLYVQATIRYLLSLLDERHSFSLIAFNQDVIVLAELLPCDDDNKIRVQELVDALQASGSTNISEALFAGTRVLSKRGADGQTRVSTLMLFTDGLAHHGLNSSATLQSLERIRLPPGCVFNTFGFGNDHDSKLLHSIAHRAQGVYYFVETREQIASTFGECVAALLNTRAHQITVNLKCHDGARLVTLATPFKISERQVAKEYDVKLELMYSQESKTILFRLSLRKFDKPAVSHQLLTIEVDYINATSGKRERIVSAPLCVSRPDLPLLSPIPHNLDKHLNRYAAATSITEAIDMASKYQFTQAASKLGEAIANIRNSPSRDDKFCLDLASDLADCASHLSDAEAFKTGIHAAHAYASMYFMERSAGLTTRQSLKGGSNIRHLGYGYVTPEQDQRQLEAVRAVRAYAIDHLTLVH